MSSFKNGVTVGLTGQTGAGKTSIGKLLSENGCEIIDTDKIARSITEKGSPVLSLLAEAFGGDIIENGELNRKLLAKRAFSSRENTEKLNGITHPEITRLVKERAEKAFKAGKTAVIDAAALFESGEDKLCDFTAAVICPEDIRLERIISRDSLTYEQAKTRIKAQYGEEYYTGKADLIIRNYPPYSLNEETEKILREIRRVKDEKKL